VLKFLAFMLTLNAIAIGWWLSTELVESQRAMFKAAEEHNRVQDAEHLELKRRVTAVGMYLKNHLDKENK